MFSKSFCLLRVSVCFFQPIWKTPTESSIFLSVFLASLGMSLWPFFLELLMEQAMVSFQYAITLESLSRASVCSSVDGAITKPPSGCDEE